jgi:hypothetical protein
VAGVSGLHAAGEARKTCLAVSEWSTHCWAHGRSRSGNVLVPLASGGRHECFIGAPICCETPPAIIWDTPLMTMVGREPELARLADLLDRVESIRESGSGAASGVHRGRSPP